MMKRPLIFLGVGAFALTLFVCAARAQDMDNRVLLDRITQLEGQVQDLSRKAYGSSYVPGQVTNSNPSAATAPGVESRLEALEQQIRDLTGQVEQANFAARQANANLDKMKSDLEVRLQQIEQKQAAAANPPAGALSTDQPNPDATADDQPPPDDATPTPEEMYNRAYSELQKKEYDSAEKDFRDFLAQNADNKLAPNAQYWLGETYFARANYKAASAVFAESYQKYPKATKAPDSLLKLGLSLEQQDRAKDACTVLRQLMKEYPSAAAPITARAKAEIKQHSCQ